LFADYDELGKEQAQLHQEIEQLTKMLDDKRAHCEQLEKTQETMLNSASWKMASFLRQVKSLSFGGER
jgi:flagellar biosynthesis chaperone FliJ